MPDEVLKILAAAKHQPGMVGRVRAGDFFYALELFILNTGTRISAAMLTPTAGLDLDAGVVLIPAEIQKHNSDEYFDLLPCTVAALKVIRSGRNQRLFDDWPYDRKKRQWPTLNRYQKRILVNAGLFATTRDVTRKDMFHKLRRSFATFVNARGGQHLAQEMLGHSHQNVTKLYIDPRMRSRTKVTELLGEFLPPPDPPDKQRRLFDA
jgi:integrase